MCRDPYVNFLRPCFFPESFTDAKGKLRKRYRLENMRTPYEKLRSLPPRTLATSNPEPPSSTSTPSPPPSDNDAAPPLNGARTRLLQSIYRRPRRTA
jgi:hypothetical protein